MQNFMPQELEVWYLIPAIRRELAKILTKEYDMSQKKVAGLFGITESAVSQYIKSKRGNELKFSKVERDKIRKTAEKIIKDNENTRKLMFDLSVELRGTQSLCELHKKQDPSIKGDCKICMKD